MATLVEGDEAPDFKLPTDSDGDFSLSAHRGKAVILFFYPKDDTSGCTAEAIAFSASMEAFDRLGVIVAGISPDPVTSHKKFREKFSLGTILIADQEKATLENYGVWKEKSMYGRKYKGVERSTFLIDGDGRIRRIWRNVSVPGHVEEVMEAAGEMTQ
jgi:thioredoxin-dependent peroxiredoxin